jgi:hypothetical protein
MEGPATKKAFPWLSLEKATFLTCGIIVSILMPLSCGRIHQHGETANPANQNEKTAAVGVSGTEQLRLDLKSDRTKLGPGDCTDLRLEIFNQSSSSVHWSEKWTLEQEGPIPIPPEAGPRSALDILAGGTVGATVSRVCRDGLVAGTYRFRIRGYPALPSSPVSDWATLEVIP